MAGLLFVGVGILGDLLDDLAIALRRGDALFDVLGRELPFVFEFVAMLLAGGCVNVTDLLAFLEKRTVHAHVGFDGDGFVVHEETVEDGLLDIVTEHGRAEERGRVRCQRGGETNFDGVKMRECVAPEARLLHRVAAMTFVRDDEVKGVNRDVELVVSLAHPMGEGVRRTGEG